MKITTLFSLFVITSLALILTACSSPDDDQTITTRSLEVITGRDLRIVTGQTLYVPAYSQVFFGTGNRTVDLGITLAIHNTDLDSPIILQSVRYHNTDGELVRSYVSESVEVPALATTGFLVQTQDVSGGWGSNFIVEWAAEEPVSEPIVEAIMISSGSGQGVSFISLGRVISQTGGEASNE